MSLSGAQKGNLLDGLIDHLRIAHLESPYAKEGETAYTARAIAPLVDSYLRRLMHPEIVRTGGGGPGVASASFLGMNFYPDIGLTAFSQRLVAVEVKFLRDTQRQNSIATATGQALIYQQRFESVVAFLVDFDRRSPDALVLEARHFLSQRGIELVVRRTIGQPSLRIDAPPLGGSSTTDG